MAQVPAAPTTLPPVPTAMPKTQGDWDQLTAVFQNWNSRSQFYQSSIIPVTLASGSFTLNQMQAGTMINCPSDLTVTCPASGLQVGTTVYLNLYSDVVVTIEPAAGGHVYWYNGTNGSGAGTVNGQQLVTLIQNTAGAWSVIIGGESATSGGGTFTGPVTVTGALTGQDGLFITSGGASISGVQGATENCLTLNSGLSGTSGDSDLLINRAGSTANHVAEGPCIQFQDTTNNNAAIIQESGGQMEFWQNIGGTWAQSAFFNNARQLELNQELQANASVAVTGSLTVGGNAVATTSTLSAYAPLASPTFTGNVNASQVTVSGTTTTGGLLASGNISAAGGTFTGTVNAATLEQGGVTVQELPLNVANESSGFTLAQTQAGSALNITATQTVVLPAGLTVGTMCYLNVYSSVVCTISPGTSATINWYDGTGATGTSTVTGPQLVTVICYAANTWSVVPSLAAASSGTGSFSNLTVSGTSTLTGVVSAPNGIVTNDLEVTSGAPQALTIGGAGIGGGGALQVWSTNSGTATDAIVARTTPGTANTIANGPNIQMYAQTSGTQTGGTMLQNSGAQSELWQYTGSSWAQLFNFSTSRALTLNANIAGTHTITGSTSGGLQINGGTNGNASTFPLVVKDSTGSINEFYVDGTGAAHCNSLASGAGSFSGNVSMAGSLTMSASPATIQGPSSGTLVLETNAGGNPLQVNSGSSAGGSGNLCMKWNNNSPGATIMTLDGAGNLAVGGGLTVGGVSVFSGIPVNSTQTASFTLPTTAAGESFLCNTSTMTVTIPNMPAGTMMWLVSNAGAESGYITLAAGSGVTLRVAGGSLATPNMRLNSWGVAMLYWPVSGFCYVCPFSVEGSMS